MDPHQVVTLDRTDTTNNRGESHRDEKGSRRGKVGRAGSAGIYTLGSGKMSNKYFKILDTQNTAHALALFDPFSFWISTKFLASNFLEIDTVACLGILYST